MENTKLNIVYVPVNELKVNEKNPRKWTKEQKDQLKESITKFGNIDPVIANSNEGRKGVIVGGHFRFEVCKELGHTTMPVVWLNLTKEKEQELNIRLNRNHGEFDFNLLAEFDENLLSDLGFTSLELDNIFPADENPEKFDIQAELLKLNIQSVTVQKGDIYELDGSRVMCGDSTVTEDLPKLMGDEKADMCFTDSPYILSYATGKKRKDGKATKGFGLKRDRQYLETDFIPDDFTQKWMANVALIQKPDFSIIAFEHPKNLKLMWTELEKHWRYRNTIIWRVPNRVQNFAGKYKFFNKFDFAIVGTTGEVNLNDTPEHDPLLEERYEAAIFATSGQPHWESYEKGKKYAPTDYIEHNASDAKSSGQSVIFGTKPLDILIPYIKILTKRNDLIVEPFGGSGSTLVASVIMQRRCYLMEKVPAYTEVILKRWEKATGKKPIKIN